MLDINNISNWAPPKSWWARPMYNQRPTYCWVQLLQLWVRLFRCRQRWPGRSIQRGRRGPSPEDTRWGSSGGHACGCSSYRHPLRFHHAATGVRDRCWPLKKEERKVVIEDREADKGNTCVRALLIYGSISVFLTSAKLALAQNMGSSILPMWLLAPGLIEDMTFNEYTRLIPLLVVFSSSVWGVPLYEGSRVGLWLSVEGD